MLINVYLLFPFDMGLELDFVGKDTKEIFKEIYSRRMQNLTFEGKIFSNPISTIQFFKFGTGLIQISFVMQGDFAACAHLSCNAEHISAGKTRIVPWCKSLVDNLINKAQRFATYKYERRLDEVDLFPIFSLEPQMLSEGGENKIKVILNFINSPP